MTAPLASIAMTPRSKSVEDQAAQATEAGRGVIRDSRLPAREGAIPVGTVPRTAFL